MYRFIALFWNPVDQDQLACASLALTRIQASSRKWTSVANGDGYALFHAGVRSKCSDAHILADGAGVIFGKLFRRGDGGAHSSVSTKVSAFESAAIRRGFGRALATEYWGRYVAILHDRQTAGFVVFRDPSGSLPCFTTAHSGVRFFFSDMEDCSALRLQKYTINWDYVSAVIAFSTPQTEQTGLNEVTELQPGESIELRAGSAIKSRLWDPVEVARSRAVENPNDAIALVRETISGCVHAWASCHDRICLSLSGGLDSSIVLACLHDAPHRPGVTCFHHYFPDLQSDERPFARRMATRAGVELIEHLSDPHDVHLQELLNVSKASRPWFYLYDLAHSSFEVNLAQDRGATALFTGNGGDSVFLQGHANLAVADYVFQKGVRPGVVGVARDAAAITRTSAWTLLSKGIRSGLARPPWQYNNTKSLERTFVSRELIAWCSAHEHYWVPNLRTAHDLPHGKRSHIAGLVVPINFYYSIPRANAPEGVHPLLAQPVVELGLRIPPHVMIAGGLDRAIERRAFEKELPQEILRREAKGTANQFLKDVLEANPAFVEDFLMNGVQCERGLLSREKLRRYFRGAKKHGIEHNEIIGTRISTEAWLRRWLEVDSQAVAA